MNNFGYLLLFCLSVHINFANENSVEPIYKRILKQHILDDYAFFMMQFYSGNLLELVESGKSLPNRVLLVGPYGMNKEDLARYLAKRHCTCAYDLFGFEDRKERVIRSFDRLFQDYPIAIVIGDINKIDRLEDADIKERFYNALDRLQASENLLIIATVSDEKILSDNLKKYFDHIYTIDPFDDNSRLKVFKYFFNNYELNYIQEEYFLYKTDGYSLENIEDMFPIISLNKKTGAYSAIVSSADDVNYELGEFFKEMKKFFEGF